MSVPQSLPSRLIGALFVERGLVSESQIRIALEIQNETGQQLGQILVERFGVSRRELASVVAEQWAKLGGSSGPEDTASWRRLGEIFVDRGFVSQEELEQALARQRQTGERLGEALVAQGVISKFELAGALAEQMAALEGAAAAEAAADAVAEATVHRLPVRPDEPSDTAPAPVLELVPSEQNGSWPPQQVDVSAEANELAAVEEAAEPEAEPEPDELQEPDGPQADAFADTGAVLPHAEETTVDDVVAVEPPVDGVAFDESPVGDVAFADPVVEDVAFDEQPVEDVAFAEPPVDDVAFDEPLVEDGALDEPPVDDVPFEQSVVNDVAFVEPVGADVALEEPPVDSVEVEEPAVVEVAALEPAVACVAFAPTTRGYRLVTLDAVPAAGETIDVPDVGLRLVLRVGRSPYPLDDRICAFVEEPVVWAFAVDAVH